MRSKLIRILEIIIMSVITVLLYLAVVYLGIAIWWTGHPIGVKLSITACSIFTCAFGLYVGTLRK